jgi:glycosyltransferase involved in cell wall biosynthesis
LKTGISDAGDLVTVIIPVYNEAATIREVIRRVEAAPFEKEILLVDDGSTDGTSGEAEQLASDRVRVIRLARNEGKGVAIRAALPHARGKAVIIQDADLEYDPEDIPALVGDILEGREAVVYGNRFHHGFPPGMAFANRVINRILASMVTILYGHRLSDEATCYKAFRTDVLLNMKLTSRRFEFCPEVTAKALRAGYRIAEKPIRYVPRSKSAGKKIRWWDGVIAIWTLIKFRFVR